MFGLKWERRVCLNLPGFTWSDFLDPRLENAQSGSFNLKAEEERCEKAIDKVSRMLHIAGETTWSSKREVWCLNKCEMVTWQVRFFFSFNKSEWSALQSYTG